MPATPELAKTYLLAKEFVIEHGFCKEIDWQDEISFKTLGETEFLSEMAWVVLCSGFRENTLRKRFGLISQAFLHWCSAKTIWIAEQECRRKALSVFNNPRKIDAILWTCRLTAQMGFPEIKRRIEAEGIEFLDQLPFIGSTTAFHLAKNLGMCVTKPDRHLIRAAKAAGYDSPSAMCWAIAEAVCEKVSVVDLVIWRYATLNPAYEEYFAEKCKTNQAYFGGARSGVDSMFAQIEADRELMQDHLCSEYRNEIRANVL